MSLILVTLAAAVGLGVVSTLQRGGTVRALWVLSGIYLILQAVLSFGFGAYIAGRVFRSRVAAPTEEVEIRDGIHGLAVWALAVVIGSVVAAVIGAAAVNRPSAPALMTPPSLS